MSTRASTPDPSPYRGQRIAVGTRHGKQHQFSPAFRDILQAELVTPPDLDTDRFGTFTGEVSRRGDAVDAARAKARLAIEVTGLSCGLASEASYGPLPGLGWHGHEEILLFCDDDAGLEVLEGYRSIEVPGARHTVGRGDDVPPALLAGLPDQALIVRPSDATAGTDGTDGIAKGLTERAAVYAAIDAAAAHSADGRAVVEPDLRAHYNPSRRRVLAGLAETLARRLATRCPGCGRPGFGRVDSETGLPCRVCGTPTPLPRAEIHACDGCGHQLSRPVAVAAADPAHCVECNP